MARDLPPVSVGTAGLVGRPLIVRKTDLEEPDGYDEEGNPIWEKPRASGPVIPSNCLRVLHSPLPHGFGGGCSHDCPGLQRDGSCLCDIVRAANEQGVEWSFEIDREDYWVYNGPELHLPEPGESVTVPARVETFLCPHCRHLNELDLGNWHYWCSSCGKNASDT